MADVFLFYFKLTNFWPESILFFFLKLPITANFSHGIFLSFCLRLSLPLSLCRCVCLYLNVSLTRRCPALAFDLHLFCVSLTLPCTLGSGIDLSRAINVSKKFHPRSSYDRVFRDKIYLNVNEHVIGTKSGYNHIRPVKNNMSLSSFFSKNWCGRAAFYFYFLFFLFYPDDNKCVRIYAKTYITISYDWIDGGKWSGKQWGIEDYV